MNGRKAMEELTRMGLTREEAWELMHWAWKEGTATFRGITVTGHGGSYAVTGGMSTLCPRRAGWWRRGLRLACRASR